MSKSESENVEYVRDGHDLSEEHRDYLMRRHGTLELDPIPHMDDDDPLNWPQRKKALNLVFTAFHAMMALVTASSIQSAFVNIAADLDISVQQTSYLVSLVIAVLGGAPLFWRPLANTYGRRPVFLISLIVSLIGNVGCALSHSYATMALCRAITAFFISPAASIGSAVVSETFFRKQRAACMGVWTIMVTLGVPIAPFIFGFVALRVGYRWIYWTLAITNGVHFILYFFLGSETRYEPSTKVQHKPSFMKRYFSFRRIDPAPLTFMDFIRPLALFSRMCVILPAISYAMVFLWAGVMITFEIPQIFPEKFGFNTQQVGLQYVGIIVGTLVGEQFGGILSDKWMWFRERKGKAPSPEFRLWLSYIGHLLSICGVVVFLVQVDRASDHWNVTPIIGAGIAAAGNQIVTTIIFTYSVDCYPEDSAAIGVFITFIRQMWGFIGPFWIPDMIKTAGLSGTAGIASGMMVVVSILPMLLLQWKGPAWR